MATYFESINDGNSLQISDGFSNYVLWKKGRAYSEPGGATSTQMWDVRAPIPSSGSRPIIVYEPVVRGTGILSLFQKNDGATQRSKIYSSDVFTRNQELNYYVFIPSDDPSINLEPAKGLFCLWNEQGKLIYDSDAPYLKVLEYREHYYNEGSYTNTYPNAKKIGLAVSESQWYVNQGGAGGGWTNLAGTSAYADVDVANKIIFNYMLFRIRNVPNEWPSIPPEGSNRPKAVKLLVCDLTNLDKIPFEVS
ncbi:hypothetical protein H7A76_31275 [Pseudomonas sp. MSSRFD41]|uniref:hypothetical protein n=1 Tax=Pseudomonas sp. MSSRFD41 TaxID=1310370 RepID=UPI00163AEA26|nr:hypothetical protein [Pseudomonas sp. MSSRFD41]MBC2659933.1 hypothetical protein [Pseudomonas sp. MSSRFD41]